MGCNGCSPSIGYSSPQNTTCTYARVNTMNCPSDNEETPIAGIVSGNYVCNYGNTGTGYFQLSSASGSLGLPTSYNGVVFSGAPFQWISAGPGSPVQVGRDHHQAPGDHRRSEQHADVLGDRAGAR